MSVLGDRLRGIARECVAAAHLVDGDVTDEIGAEDIAAMMSAWTKQDWRTPEEGYRAELRALIAVGWRKPRPA